MVEFYFTFINTIDYFSFPKETPFLWLSFPINYIPTLGFLNHYLKYPTVHNWILHKFWWNLLRIHQWYLFFQLQMHWIISTTSPLLLSYQYNIYQYYGCSSILTGKSEILIYSSMSLILPCAFFAIMKCNCVSVNNLFFLGLISFDINQHHLLSFL